MATLKELTWAHHEAAETRPVAKELISGNIDPKLYHKYLCCQYMNYEILERFTKIPENVEAIKRAPRIFQDILELEQLYGFNPPGKYPPSVEKYRARINQLGAKGDNHALLAHMYVRHFGDAHGGQIIKKKTPGSGLMYEFDGLGRKGLIDEFRKLLSDDMADEAKICFDFASELFDELAKEMDNSPK